MPDVGDLLDVFLADTVLALVVSPAHSVEQVHRLSPPVAVVENVVAFPDSENVVQERAQPNYMKRQQRPVDDVACLWRVPLFGVLSPYYEVRKQQGVPMSTCRLGSLYSGLCSESFALTQMRIPHVTKFTCDQWPYIEIIL